MRLRLLPLLTIGFLLAACSADGGGTTGSSSSPASTAPSALPDTEDDDEKSPDDPADADDTTPSPTPTAQPDAVKSFDLGDVSWYDLEADRSFTLSKGRYTRAGVVWTLSAKSTVYADADGDGDLDALAVLQRLDGNALSLGYYVWIWDATKQTASQLRDLVAATHSCGDGVLSTKPAAKGGWVLREQLRAKYDTTDCASGGSIKRNRTVVVEDGALVAVAPYRGYGGICAVPAEEGATQPAAGRVTIRVAPKAGSAVAIAPKSVEVLAGPWIPASARTWPGGWTQVSFLTHAMKASDDVASRPPCGFIKSTAGSGGGGPGES